METREQKITFRLSPKEVELLKGKVEQTRVGKSEFIRRAILGMPIHSATDHQMVSELKRLGAMMKHQYPKYTNWLDHEKKDYWQLMKRLNALANRLQENILKDE